MEERYGSLAGAGSCLPSLGILFLAAITRQKGFPTAVTDASALGLTGEALLKRVEAEHPDVLGLSSTTFSIFHAAKFAALAKERFPGLTVIIGGPHVSAAPQETMERFPVFDVAVLGEGEVTIIELLEAMDAKASLGGIPGIVLRDGGKLVTTSRRPFLKDLDSLPRPAWDLLEGFPQRYRPAPFKVRRFPAASFVTSRGCPNQCIFCDRSVFGASCHAFSAEYVVEMIRHLVENFGIREFSFEDDTFITFKKRLVAICQGIIDLGVNISWTCLGRVNSVDKETLQLMRRAGCWQISFGIESGCQEILTTIHKNVTLEQIQRDVVLCREAGILSKGFFIVGHPGETRETLSRTRDFALKLPLDDISVTMLTPFPGTEIYERASEFGEFDRDWARMNLLNTVFIPRGLTREELEHARRELLRRFYLRPRIILGYLRRLAMNPAMAKGMFQGARAFFRSIGSSSVKKNPTDKNSFHTPKDPPRVSVIIVNWNGKEFLSECLDSLRNQTYNDFETIVVDNGSKDGSLELLRESYPWVRLVPLNSNTGFAGGNDAGLSAARGRTYIVTLNNDTRVDRSWLAELIAAAESSTKVGMVASRVCAWDDPDQLDSLGVAICPDGMSRGSRRRARFSALSVAKTEDILLPSACAALYRREMIDDIGFFDDDFFAYCEDTDLGLRGRLAGWRAVLARDAIVQHCYSRSGGAFSPLKLYLVERNHFWVALKCFPAMMLLTLPFWTMVRYLMQVRFVLGARGAGAQFREAPSGDLTKAVLRGLWDAVCGLPSVLRKRRATMEKRRLSIREIRQLLKTYRLTFRELLDAG